MKRSIGLFSSLACASVLASAAVAQIPSQTTERLQADGVAAHELSVNAGATLTFVNADARPHQIYSPDCGELSSVVLAPGQTHSAVLRAGPKLCHFQDLLVPLDASYAGTVAVKGEPVQYDPYPAGP
jgi:plastocyanin